MDNNNRAENGQFQEKEKHASVWGERKPGGRRCRHVSCGEHGVKRQNKPLAANHLDLLVLLANETIC